MRYSISDGFGVMCIFLCWLLIQFIATTYCKELLNLESLDINKKISPYIINPLFNRLGRTVNKVENASFIRSKIDDSIYRYIRLRNQMNAFLVSNKAFLKSVIRLSIGVGSIADPIELPGLASLVQDSLCLGTYRYFEHSNFCNYLNSINGIMNLEVHERNSIFTVEVENRYIKPTVERFCDIIRNPIFPEKLFFMKTADYVGTFDSLLNDENFLFQCIKRNISMDDEVFRRQMVLNDRSLQEAKLNSGINLLEQVRIFHKNNYSANIMTIVVASNESMPKLFKYVISNCSLIRNLGISKLLPLDLARIIRHPHLNNVGSIIHTRSNSSNELILEFPIEYQEVLWDSSPSYYLEYLLNDNSNSSLSGFLISKGLILKMEAKTKSNKYAFSTFEIKFVLPDQGVNQIKSIIQATFIFIEYIKTTPIKQELLVEIQQRLKYKFDYYFKIEPRYITKLIINSFDFKGCSPEEVLIAGNIVRNSNLEEVSEFIDKISLENIIIFIRHLNLNKYNIRNLNLDPGIFQLFNRDLFENNEYIQQHHNSFNFSSEIRNYTKSSSNLNAQNIEHKRISYFNLEYYTEELSKEFIDQINKAVDLIKPKYMGIKLRKKNKLLGNTPLHYFKNTTNYKIYSPLLLKDAIIDFLRVENSKKLKNFHLKIRKNIEIPIYKSILFYNNVNFQAPVATFFLRIMIPHFHPLIPSLPGIDSSKELILALEILVNCLNYSASSIIKNMHDLEGVFSIESNLKSDMKGVPYGFEIKIRGYLGSIFLALNSFSRIILHLRRNITQEKFENILNNLELKSKRENLNKSPAEVSSLILTSLFETNKISSLLLETDFSKISLEQVSELSYYLGKYGSHEGAIIGNINPLQAYTIINQFITSIQYEYKEYSIEKINQDFSTEKSNLKDSMQIWEILDPSSLNEEFRNIYYYNAMYFEHVKSSNTLLYVPFSTFSVDSITFKVLFDYLINIYKGKKSTIEIELDTYPKMNGIVITGFTICYSSNTEDIISMSEKILHEFNSIMKMVMDMKKEEFEKLKKNHFLSRELELDYEHFETKIFYQVVFRRNLFSILNKIKSSLVQFQYEDFIQICNSIMSSPKILIATQKKISDFGKLRGIENYVPNRFRKLENIDELTSMSKIKTHKIPLRFIEGALSLSETTH